MVPVSCPPWPGSITMRPIFSPSILVIVRFPTLVGEAGLGMTSTPGETTGGEGTSALREAGLPWTGSFGADIPWDGASSLPVDVVEGEMGTGGLDTNAATAASLPGGAGGSVAAGSPLTAADEEEPSSTRVSVRTGSILSFAFMTGDVGEATASATPLKGFGSGSREGRPALSEGAAWESLRARNGSSGGAAVCEASCSTRGGTPFVPCTSMTIRKGLCISVTMQSVAAAKSSTTRTKSARFCATRTWCRNSSLTLNFLLNRSDVTFEFLISKNT